MSHAALRQLSRVGLPARAAASSSRKLSLRPVTSTVWSHTNDATRARADEDRAWAWSPSCSQHPPPLSAQGRLRGAIWPGMGSARAQLCQLCAPEAETEATAAARTVLAIDPDMNGALVVLRYRRRTQYSSDAGAQNGASVDVVRPCPFRSAGTPRLRRHSRHMPTSAPPATWRTIWTSRV